VQFIHFPELHVHETEKLVHLVIPKEHR